MSNVTMYTIVDEMQTLIEEVKADKKIDLEKKIKLITTAADRQLRAGSLSLQWARAVGRLPENAASLVPPLNAPEIGTQPTKQ